VVARGLIVAQVTITILQQIINVTWQKESCNVEKLSRWIRCFFTLALKSSDETAEQLLDQVVTITEEARKVRIFSELVN